MTYDRRISSLLVVVAIVVGALTLNVNAALSWREQSNALQDFKAHTRLLEERAALAAGKTVSAGAAPDQRLLISGETSGLVSAELQRILSDIAQRSGASVRSLDVPESEPVGTIVDATGRKLVRVHLNTDVEVTEQALPDFLYALETNLPMIVVDAVSLRPNRQVQTDGEGTIPSASRPLSLGLTVSAFHLQVPE
jgi:hypothetical protein